MKVLILGSGGQLGKSLLSTLSNNELYSCIFLNRIEFDLSNTEFIVQKIKKYNPNIIINCAGYTQVDLAEDNKVLADTINNLAVMKIAQACKEINCIFIHISTDYVFDGEAKKPYKEDAKTNPNTIYGKTKLNGEISIIESGCKYIIIRTSWVFSESGKNFLKTILNLLKKENKINVVNDQIGCPTYAIELAKAIKKIILKIITDKFHGGIFHFSSNEEISWFDFANYIHKKYQTYDEVSCKVLPIDSSKFKVKAKRPKYSVLDSSKIKKIYDIHHPKWKESCDQSIEKILSLSDINENIR